MVSVQGSVETGHEDMVHDAQMDFYGGRLATCSSDRLVKIFQIKDGVQQHVADLKGHEGPVWQVAWAHPRYGSILASCSYDRKVILWKEEPSGAWTKLEEYTNFESSVNSVCWAPFELGLILAAGSSDGSISIITYTGGVGSTDGSLWEAEKIHNAHMIGCNAVSWYPLSDQKRFVSGGCDNLVKLWRFDEREARWTEELKLEGHTDWVRDVAWGPSIGKGRNVIASCSQDRRAFIWTNEAGSSNWVPKVLNMFDDVVWHVSWSIGGNMLAVSGGDNKVSLWKETSENQWSCISDVNKGQGTPTASAQVPPQLMSPA